MKYLRHFFSLSLLLIFLVSCNNSNTKVKAERIEKDSSFENLFEKKIIPVDQGVLMHKEHVTKRSEPLEPILKKIYKDEGFQDTKFVYFSLEDMKDYIKFLEEIQSDNPDQDVSGLRVYFAAYPDKKTINGRSIKNPRQQTVFMVPTVYIGNADKTYNNLNNLPFYIEKNTANNSLKGDLVIIEDLMLDYKKKARLEYRKRNEKTQKASFGLKTNLSFTYDKESVSTVFNEGEMSPPPLGD